MLAEKLPPPRPHSSAMNTNPTKLVSGFCTASDIQRVGISRVSVLNMVKLRPPNMGTTKEYSKRNAAPERPGEPSAMVRRHIEQHVIFTAETHNFPTGVAPFPGAETGTGGRIRDVQGTGKGGFVIAGTAAYCVANLHIPGYELPWEEKYECPSNLTSALEIEIEASNGASDYGNKFGEPVIQGFTRSAGLRLPGGERREWIKPIMFSGGIGKMDHGHVTKGAPEVGMWVVKLGGPAYRIGMGGGAAMINIGDMMAKAMGNGMPVGAC